MTVAIIDIESSFDVSLPVEEGLRRHARVWLRPILSERQTAITRIAIMEAARFPNFAKRFFELGPQRGQTRMAEYFRKKVLSGELVDEDPGTMSEHYLSLLLGGSIRWRQLQLSIQSRNRASPLPFGVLPYTANAASEYVKTHQGQVDTLRKQQISDQYPSKVESLQPTRQPDREVQFKLATHDLTDTIGDVQSQLSKTNIPLGGRAKLIQPRPQMAHQLAKGFALDIPAGYGARSQEPEARIVRT